MATNFTANAASDQRPAASVSAFGQLSVNHGEYAITAALVINDQIGLCKLPAGHIPVDLIATIPDLDTNGTPLIVFDIGLSALDFTVVDQDAFVAAATTAQAGGLQRMTATAAREIAPADTDRMVVMKVTTAPATGATSGTISATLLSRRANADD